MLWFQRTLCQYHGVLYSKMLIQRTLTSNGVGVADVKHGVGYGPRHFDHLNMVFRIPKQNVLRSILYIRQPCQI